MPIIGCIGSPSDESTLGSTELLERNMVRRKCAICFLSTAFTFTIVSLLVFFNSYYAYYKRLDSPSSPFNYHTTIPSTTKFMNSESTSTDSFREISPRNTLVTKNTTRIIHRKRNTSVIPHSEVEFIAMPAIVENSKSSVTDFHDSTTEFVKYKTKKRKLFNILTNKFVELNMGTKSTESNHEMRHNLQRQKLIPDHIKY